MPNTNIKMVDQNLLGAVVLLFFWPLLWQGHEEPAAERSAVSDAVGLPPMWWSLATFLEALQTTLMAQSTSAPTRRASGRSLTSGARLLEQAPELLLCANPAWQGGGAAALHPKHAPTLVWWSHQALA